MEATHYINPAHSHASIIMRPNGEFTILGIDDELVSDDTLMSLFEGVEVDGWKNRGF